MTEFVPIDTPVMARRSRTPTILVVAGLALVIGLALMAWAVRDDWLPWVTRTEAVTPPLGITVNAPTPAPVQPGAAISPAIAAIDPATLAARETALAAQLSSLEARSATVQADAAAAGDKASRAEAILIAFAARRAIDRGIALGYLEEQLRQRFASGQPRATLAILRASRQPVTLEALRQGLDGLTPQLVGGSDGDWLGNVTRELGTLIVLHRAGTPSPLPADRMVRVQRMVEMGQIEPALADVMRLPGAAAAANWLVAARRYVEVHRALDTIETAAILGQATPPVVVMPIVPVAAPPPVMQTAP